MSGSKGDHADNMLVMVDAAPGIPNQFLPSVEDEGILAGGNARLLMLGNPTVSSGLFCGAFGRNAAVGTRFSIFVDPRRIPVELK